MDDWKTKPVADNVVAASASPCLLLWLFLSFNHSEKASSKAAGRPNSSLAFCFDLDFRRNLSRSCETQGRHPGEFDFDQEVAAMRMF